MKPLGKMAMPVLLIGRFAIAPAMLMRPTPRWQTKSGDVCGVYKIDGA